MKNQIVWNKRKFKYYNRLRYCRNFNLNLATKTKKKTISNYKMIEKNKKNEKECLTYV